MPAITVALAVIIFGSGVAAGSTGALLGIGGGVFLVPLLHLALGFPLRTAAAVSLTTVIATSSSVSARKSGEQLINLRLGMVLEVATVAGSLLGGSVIVEMVLGWPGIGALMVTAVPPILTLLREVVVG